MSTDRREGPLAAPWGAHVLAPGADVAVQVGPLLLRARSRSDEIWLASHPGRSTGQGVGELPPTPEEEADEWTRWPVPEAVDAVHLSPVLPPRPLVAQPELSFRLLPGSEARIYIRVPVWVRIEIEAPRGRIRLADVPTVVLSDTWWGGHSEGELGYWLATTARRRVEDAVFEPHLVVCPLQLSNGSSEELEVDRIAIQVSHLTLFAEHGRLWADETRIRYRGEAEGSDIRMEGRPPLEAPEAARIAAPRVPLPKGFRARAFARLRVLRSLGLHG